MPQHCTLRITLEGIAPAIWRRVSVPAHWTLFHLHRVIQIVMPWEEEHLHVFTDGKQSYSPQPAHGEKDEGKVELRSVLSKEGSKLTYTNDFAEPWVHEIVSDGVAERPEQHVVCLDGARAAPPTGIEDVSGYESLLADLKDPKNATDPERLEWFEGYDPADFDMDALNAELREFDREALEGPDEPFTDEQLEEMASHYDASAGPSGDYWDFDDDDQCLIIEAHHHLQGAEVAPAVLHVHCLFHHIVENQLREKNPVEARSALKRLLAGGLDRHDAIHALAATNAELMQDAHKGDESAVDRLGPALTALTAESWRARSDPWEPKLENVFGVGPDSGGPAADDADDFDFSTEQDAAPTPGRLSPEAVKRRKDKRKAQKRARKRGRR